MSSLPAGGSQARSVMGSVVRTFSARVARSTTVRLTPAGVVASYAIRSPVGDHEVQSTATRGPLSSTMFEPSALATASTTGTSAASGGLGAPRELEVQPSPDPGLPQTNQTLPIQAGPLPDTGWTA